MQAHELVVDGVHVLQIEGDIDLSVSPELRHILADHARVRQPALVLDCTGVRYVDSSGLATLIEYVRNAQEFGGKFALAGVSERVRTVIELVRLHEFLPIYLTVADATLALASAPPSA